MRLKPQPEPVGNGYSKTLDLGEMTPLRFSQYQQWHDLLIAGPTRNVVGTVSNDFPGLYYYDPRTQMEYVVMVSGPVDWRYASLERRLVPHPNKRDGWRLELGLFSKQPLNAAVQIKTTSQKRTLLEHAASDRDAMPGQWEALETLVEKSFQLLPLPQPAPAYDWENAAAVCLGTLRAIKVKREQNGKAVWAFFETFRSGGSTYHLEPDKEHSGSTELICQGGLAASLLEYAAAGPRDAKAYQALGLEIAEHLSDFYDAKTETFQNTYPPRGEEWTRGVVDTWYTFNNLYQVLRVSQLTKDALLTERALQSVERLIRFVRACDYSIPLFAKITSNEENASVEDGQVIGYALNPSVLGMHAALLVLAAKVLPEKQEAYHAEAKASLKRLRRWPLALMFHETPQLSWAAGAADALGEPAWRDDFTRCLLLNCYRKDQNAGLFQGCSGLNYPAFRETVQAIEPWLQWLDKAPRHLPLRQIVDLVFSKSEAFWSRQDITATYLKRDWARLSSPKPVR